MITSKEAVWLPYIVEIKNFVPTYKENTPDWIKEAHYLYRHKQQEKFFDLLEAHGVIESEKEA